MKKLALLTLLSLGFLTACASPKVTDIHSKYVDNNPINYKTISTSDIYVETRQQLDGDVLTQEFGGVTISYYEENGNTVTTETYDTINDAINNNKTGMTRVQNKGRGTIVTYTAHLKDTTEERTYNVPYIAEVSTKVETEAEMKKLNQLTNSNGQGNLTIKPVTF